MHDQSREEDETARLFRENDNLGPDSSLWLRPLRQLLAEGKPVGPVVALAVALPEPHGSVFGMLTATTKRRLVFWPVLPPEAKVTFEGEIVKALDHITLELPSERIHATAYDAAGKRTHASGGWRLRHLSGCNSALWFNLLVRVDILGSQAAAVQRSVAMPSSDAERRERQFRGYAGQLAFCQVGLPPRQSESDFIYLGVCLAPEGEAPDVLSSAMLPAGPAVDGLIEGWPEGDEFPIAGSSFTIGGRTVYIAAACPPGRLLSEVAFGLPRAIPSRSVAGC